MSSASSDALAGVSIMMRDLYILVTGHTPPADRVVRYSRFALLFTIGLALAFALTSDNIISYITKMIATVMAGMFVCAILGKFWGRYNWQGAIATLVAASSTSLAIISHAGWSAYWGNPSIPAVIAAVVAGVVVSLLTPRCLITPQEALARVTEEREAMETPVKIVS